MTNFVLYTHTHKLADTKETNYREGNHQTGVYSYRLKCRKKYDTKKSHFKIYQRQVILYRLDHSANLSSIMVMLEWNLTELRGADGIEDGPVNFLDGLHGLLAEADLKVQVKKVWTLFKSLYRQKFLLSSTTLPGCYFSSKSPLKYVCLFGAQNKSGKAAIDGGRLLSNEPGVIENLDPLKCADLKGRVKKV